MKHLTLYILLIISLISCKQYPDDVLQALELSGENKEELIKFLDYAKKEGHLEFKAACYLVENMKYHKSNDNIILDKLHVSYFAQTDSLYKNIFEGMSLDKIKIYKSKEYDDLRKQRAEQFKLLPPVTKNTNILTDLQVLNSDFLIDNLDNAFLEWKTNPLLKDMGFDEFKEFILPYRITNENITLKRSEIRNIYKEIISVDGYKNISYPIERFNMYVKQCRWLNYYIKEKEHLGIYDLFVPRFNMDCHNMTNICCNILRSCGVPAVYEYTPQWIDRDKRHFWTTSPDSTGIYKPYTAPDNNLMEDWDSDIRYAGKVYRRTFAANKDTPYFLSNEDEYILSIFLHHYYQTKLLGITKQ